MKVAVTGGSGRVGNQLIRLLLDQGDTVFNLDRRAPKEHLCPFRYVDLTDLGRVYDCLQDLEAVVHLAAYPSPYGAPPETIFGANVMGTYHVAQATEAFGMQRLVFASTDSTLGFPFKTRPFLPQYLPIDEQHPQLPQDPYGLSKQVGEEILKTLTRKTGVTTVALRITYIATEESYERFPTAWRNPSWGAFNLWSYLDIRDAATAFSLALKTPLEGYHVYYIAEPETVRPEPTIELIATHYPGEIQFRHNMEKNASLLDTTAARRDLDWAPKHHWQDYLSPDQVNERIKLSGHSLVV
ncbi:MAG: NAD(P)-dependent oxidoreductase [Armatimonadetes bacterium]|nr:NAD(P)-dependent oxidoreductase [Armatimonadota bacterium]